MAPAGALDAPLAPERQNAASENTGRRAHSLPLGDEFDPSLAGVAAHDLPG